MEGRHLEPGPDLRHLPAAAHQGRALPRPGLPAKHHPHRQGPLNIILTESGAGMQADKLDAVNQAAAMQADKPTAVI